MRRVIFFFFSVCQAIENIRLLSPSGERLCLAQIRTVQVQDGTSEIYQEANSRYVAIKYWCGWPRQHSGLT